MIDETRCIHGIEGRCALCRIDRRERLGARTAERILAGVRPFVSGVCAMDPPAVNGEHERCRMIGCECGCHAT